MIFIGPFPPPVHGQALATLHLADELGEHGVDVRRVDSSSGVHRGTRGHVVRLIRHVRAAMSILGLRSPVYISANSNSGMWLTAALAGLARLKGSPVFIHHHAYDHIRRRRPNMVALARMGGADAVHIVLGDIMATDLQVHTPEVKSTFVLNNAGLVDGALAGLRLSRPEHGVVLGHLSNLGADKGLAEVLDLALTLKRLGRPTRLVIGGPANEEITRSELARAKQELGDLLDYRGPLYGAGKLHFFEEISVFVFPTKYRNEASPLVLLEAMSAGVPCLSVALGCISSDLGGRGGFAFSPDVPFVDAAMKALDVIVADYFSHASAARDRYQELLGQHRSQVLALAGRVS